MSDPATPRESQAGARRGGPTPGTIQRIEGGLVAALAMTGTVLIEPGLWWFPLALFLAFDLSMVGYLRSPVLGALAYNAVHTYIWPVLLMAGALVMGGTSSGLARWFALVALAWALHVGVDRMLGYGLKLPSAFEDTHLGRIGRSRVRDEGEQGKSGAGRIGAGGTTPGGAGTDTSA